MDLQELLNWCEVQNISACDFSETLRERYSDRSSSTVYLFAPPFIEGFEIRLEIDSDCYRLSMYANINAFYSKKEIKETISKMDKFVRFLEVEGYNVEKAYL